MNPTQEVQAFLVSKGYGIFTKIGHKQIWRCKIVAFVTKLLGVSLFPVVEVMPKPAQLPAPKA